MSACVDDRRDRVEREVGDFGGLDDLLAVGVALGSKRGDQADELVVAAGAQVGTCVAQRGQVDEANRFAGVALDIGLLGVSPEPLWLDPAAGWNRRLEANLGGTVAGRGCEARHHARLLGVGQAGQLHLEFELVGDAVSLPVVGEVLFAQPAARAWSRLGLKDRAQGVDDVALACVVLADDHRQRIAEPDGGVEVAIAGCPEGVDIHEWVSPRTLTWTAASRGPEPYRPSGQAISHPMECAARR